MSETLAKKEVEKKNVDLEGVGQFSLPGLSIFFDFSESRCRVAIEKSEKCEEK